MSSADTEGGGEWDPEVVRMHVDAAISVGMPEAVARKWSELLQATDAHGDALCAAYEEETIVPLIGSDALNRAYDIGFDKLMAECRRMIEKMGGGPLN